MAADHILILKETGYGVVPSYRSLPNLASSLMSAISSMHISFLCLLLLPLVAFRRFARSLSVPPHVSLCLLPKWLYSINVFNVLKIVFFTDSDTDTFLLILKKMTAYKDKK